MTNTDTVAALFLLVLDAFRAVRRTDREGQGEQASTAARSYRNGLLDAYVLVTGEDAETVHERVMDALIAEHEIQIAQEA